MGIKILLLWLLDKGIGVHILFTLINHQIILTRSHSIILLLIFQKSFMQICFLHNNSLLNYFKVVLDLHHWKNVNIQALLQTGNKIFIFMLIRKLYCSILGLQTVVSHKEKKLNMRHNVLYYRKYVTYSSDQNQDH